VKASLPNSMPQAENYALGQSMHSSMNWHNKCDHFVGAAYGLNASGYTTAAAHWAGIPAGYKGSGTPPAGALVFWHTGPDGHVALSAGGGQVWSTDFVRDGHVDLTHVSDITKHWGGYLGWSYPYFHGKTSPIATMGDGGIALQHGRYELAERGRGEAVIPLDGRGAAVLAETMGRYVTDEKAAVARTAPYAVHTLNAQQYTYDQRVQVLGPVSVPANDPNEFMRKMDERARQARLVQPAGRS